MSGFYSVLELPVSEERRDELVRGFAELGVFELAGRSGALRSARLLRPAAPGQPLHHGRAHEGIELRGIHPLDGHTLAFAMTNKRPQPRDIEIQEANGIAIDLNNNSYFRRERFFPGICL